MVNSSEARFSRRARRVAPKYHSPLDNTAEEIQSTMMSYQFPAQLLRHPGQIAAVLGRGTSTGEAVDGRDGHCCFCKVDLVLLCVNPNVNDEVVVYG